MTHVPIIPPYEPATGISQTPERPHQRRPTLGRMSDEEAKIEAAYLPKALAIVKAMWGHYSVQDIALEIFRQTDHWNTKPALVYALKRRLDRGQG